MAAFRRCSGVRRTKAVLLVLCLLTASVLFLECRLKPIIVSAAAIQAQSMATVVINQSVEDVMNEMDLTAEELETVTLSEDGRIASISTNTVIVNKLKNAVTLRIQEGISNIRNREVNIPLGTIIGGELINGRGPSVPVYISLSGNAAVDFKGELSEGGINQTVHTLSLYVRADIHIILPGGSAVSSVETTVMLGETVIVGTVPSGMLFNAERAARSS